MRVSKLIKIGVGLTLVSPLGCGENRDEEADPMGIGTAGFGDDDDDTTTGDDDDDDDDDQAEGDDDDDDNAGGSTGPQGFDPMFDVGWTDIPVGEESDCQTGPLEDGDGDGFTKADGDCNDCDANVNPGAIEVIDMEPDEMGVIPEPADEDCDGMVDNVEPSCDGAIAIDEADPITAAGAMGLCHVAEDANDYGIVSANWVRADGTVYAPVQPNYGAQMNFGPNVAPLEGLQMLVLSSGHARLPGQVGSCNSLTCYTSGAGTAPAGFPQDVPGCAGSSSINDDIALEVTLRAPTNATGYSFNFSFYSFEYPEWVCTSFNDQFIALVDPPPEGAINGNISFDAMTNPVSVNIAFFDVCAGCPLGTGELSGTGFDTWNDAGATSWLVTTAPVTGGQEVTIRFAIWDTGDAAYDSTVLIDNFQWIADGGTVSVGTVPEG